MKSLILFWREVLRNPMLIGSVIPSSKALARAMTVPLSRRDKPARVLEVGPGTGALTRWIIERLGPEDSIDLCEINPEFTKWLRERFVKPNSGGPKVRVLEGDVLQVAPSGYDFVISSIPLTILPDGHIQKLLAGLIERLTPDGVLTCIYYHGRRLRTQLAFGRERKRLEHVLEVTREFHQRHGLAKDVVWLNFPPADVYHLGRSPRPGSTHTEKVAHDHA